MAVKYKDYLNKMYKEHKELFDDFESVHAEYGLDKRKYQAKFNEQGKEALRIVEEWENKLCRQMEKGKNSAYSARLAEKFRAELRTRFPLIDFVGVTIKPADDFTIPRITFS